MLFVDDISIIVKSEKHNINSIGYHKLEINNTIDYIIKWLEANNWKLNLDKSKYIQFYMSKHNKYNFNLNIDKIKEITHTKFLGVIIDQDLS